MVHTDYCASFKIIFPSSWFFPALVTWELYMWVTLFFLFSTIAPSARPHRLGFWLDGGPCQWCVVLVGWEAGVSFLWFLNFFSSGGTSLFVFLTAQMIKIVCVNKSCTFPLLLSPPVVPRTEIFHFNLLATRSWNLDLLPLVASLSHESHKNPYCFLPFCFFLLCSWVETPTPICRCLSVGMAHGFSLLQYWSPSCR